MSLLKSLKAVSRELGDVLERTVNPQHGLINSITEEPPAEDGLGIRLVHAVVSPPTYYRDNRPSQVKTTERGTGASFSRENACWGAIGEALERYAASIYWPDRFVYGSANRLGERALNLRPMIVSGRPEVRLFNPSADRAWVEGEYLCDGRKVLVPAAMCYLGYASGDEQEVLNQSDSTGLACGNGAAPATLNAICEVIERDAFASAWLLSYQPPQLILGEAIDRLDISVQLALRSRRPSIKLFYLSQSFGVHVVVCLVQLIDGYGVVGAAASPFILRAIEKAVCEGLYSWTAGNRIPQAKRPACGEDIQTPTDHLAYYLDPQRFHIVQALFAGEKKIELVDLLVGEKGHTTVEDIAGALMTEGFQAARVDLTTADIASLGMQVVRVIVPGLQPLIFGPASVLAPDTRRLSEWRRIWALPECPLNPHPHPFP